MVIKYSESLKKVFEFVKTLNIGFTIEPKSGAKINISKDEMKGEINYKKDCEGNSKINATFGKL